MCLSDIETIIAMLRTWQLEDWLFNRHPAPTPPMYLRPLFQCYIDNRSSSLQISINALMLLNVLVIHNKIVFTYQMPTRPPPGSRWHWRRNVSTVVRDWPRWKQVRRRASHENSNFLHAKALWGNCPSTTAQIWSGPESRHPSDTTPLPVIFIS